MGNGLSSPLVFSGHDVLLRSSQLQPVIAIDYAADSTTCELQRHRCGCLSQSDPASHPSSCAQVAEFHMQLLSNERRFILAVVAGALVIANRKKADIEAQLAADGYDRMPPSKKVAPPEAPQP